jgi:hypothetical protein
MNPKIELEKDFLDFIALCNKHKVEYLVIGGYAVAIHGYPRYTKDIDVSIQISSRNAEAMVEVMKEFGFASLNLTSEDFTKEYEGVSINFIGYEDLIKNKQHAGRSQDKVDIEKLKERNK